MDDLRLAVVLKLVDQLTGPLKRARDQVKRAGDDVVSDEEARAKKVAVIGRGVVGVGAAIVGGLALAAREAIAFEAVMADVAKVAPFEDKAEIAELKRDILDLSTEIPLAKEEIASIVEAASQANIVDRMLPDDEKRQQLRDFAEEVGKISVAFDTSTEAATEFYVGLVNRAGLSLQEAGRVADAVNHLSNNTSAAASDLMNIMVRVGGIGAMAGMTQTEVAALAAAFRGASPAAEIAATSMKNFLEPLTAGESATKGQVAALEALGLTAEGVAERMQSDAQGTIVDVLERLAKLSDVERPAILRDLVGSEGLGPIANLVNNIDAIPEAFALVKEEAAYAGSAAAEFEARMAATATQIELAENTFNAIVVTVGDQLLPVINDVLSVIKGVLDAVRDWGAEAKDVELKVAGIGAAIAILGGAALLNPVVAALATIGTVIYVIIQNWDELKAYFTAFFDWLDAKAAQAGEALRSALSPNGILYPGINPDSTVGRALGVGEERTEPYVSPVSPGMQRPGPPGRALGGPAARGTLYEWQEGGHEFFVPNVDGRVITNRAFQELRGGRGGDSLTIGDIHVHAAPGQSAEEIARTVLRRIKQSTRPRQPLHDGPLYG